MVAAAFLFAGIIIGGGAGIVLIARNNQKHINRALNADKELKRRFNAAVKAAKSS